MLDINASPITLKTIINEDGSFTFMITPSMAFSSPEKFRWEITFGQGAPHRGVITFKAGEPDSQSIPQSIDPDEHYQLRVYRVSDNNNDADDELVFQQQSEHLPPLLNNAPQQSRVGGDQGTDITQVKASLVLNKDEVTIIDASALLYMHPTDPNAVLTYTLTADPAGGDLFLGDVELGNGDTFTQSDIDAARLTFRFTADNNDPTDITFTVSDGTLTLSGQTLTITPRVVVEVEDPEEDNTIDQFSETAPQKIDAEGGNDTITGGAGDDQIDGGPGDDTIDGGGGNDVIDGGDGSDSITSGAGDDTIDGGAGDDDIMLTHDGEDGDTVDFSSNEVVYTFGYDGVGIDGGDEIKGFKLGQDTLKFVVRPNTKVATLEDFLNSIKGLDGEDLTADDAFIVTMMWSFDDEFSFDGVLLHFKDATSFGGGRVSSPLLSITFDEPLDLGGLVEILGGADEVAENFDFTHAAFENLADVLPLLFGENGIDFEVLTTTITVSGDVTEDDESAKTATGTLDDDNNPLTPPPVIEFVGDDDGDGVVEGTYGTMVFDAATREWTYTLDNMRPETHVLKAGQQETEIFTFTADDTIFTVTITVNGANDAPVRASNIDDIPSQSWTVGQVIESIDLSGLFTDPDGDELTLTVRLDDGSALSTIGLEYDSANKMIIGTPSLAGLHTIQIVATDTAGISAATVVAFDIEVAPLADILGYLGKPIEAINLGNLFTDLDVATLTVTILDSSGSEVNINSIGLSYDDGTRMLTGTPTTTGAYTIKIVSSGGQDEIIFDFVLSALQPPTLTGYVGQNTEIDLGSFITDPDNVTLTVTFLNSSGVEVDIGLRYTVTTETVTDETTGLKIEKTTRAITGVPTSETGTYTLKIVATDSTSGVQAETFTFDFTLVALQPPTLTFVEEQVEANADFTATGDSVDLTNPIVPIVLGNQFADIDGNAVTLVLDNGSRELSDIGLSYDPDTKMITGTLREFGTYTIVASAGNDVNGNAIERTIVIVAESDKTLPQIIQIDDPDVLADNPHESSRNQVGIRVGAKGGSADDVTAARTDLISDYDDSDVSVFAPTDTTDAEEEYVVEGEYGRFIITRMRGEDDPDGAPAELRYYYEYYQDGDENYKNINALGAGEIAYDVLTIWAFDGLTDAELLELTVMGGPHEIPQSALDRRVFKTVVVEITGANDAPEVVAEIFDVLFTDSQAVDIDIDPANFFDVDGDTLTITVTLDDDSALSTIGLAYDPATGKITGTPNTAGPHTIKVTATDGASESASYTFILTTAAANVNTEPVVEISGTQTLVLVAKVAVTSDSDTGFNISYSDADDAHRDNDDDVSYNFYQLGRDKDGNTIRIRPADTLLKVSEDGSILLKAGVQFVSDLSFEVVATDGEGASSAPKQFTITVAENPAPVLILVGLDGLETILDNTDGGRLNRLIIQDSDTDASVFTSESFTITGDQAEKFIVKKDDDGRWYLFLKDDESLDHENIEGTILDLDITVSDGTNTSNVLEVVVSAAREYFFDGDTYEGVVYRAGEVAGTRYSIKPGIGDADLFIIDGEDGEVRFKPGSIPATFDIDGEFNFIIIERSGGDVTETVVTLYNNVPSVVSPATSADSPSDRALGEIIGPDEPTDADGVASIEYYWFAHTRPRGELRGISNEDLVAGEHATVKPLEGENDRLLTLKGEHAEKELWLIIVLTDEDGSVTYNFWAANTDGRYDIADGTQHALDLADIGMSNNDNSGDFDFVGDLGRSDSDYIKFTVEPGETLDIKVGGSGYRTARYTVIREDGSAVANQSETVVVNNQQKTLNTLEAGNYILRVTQNGFTTGPYKVSFQGIDDQPTNFQLTEAVEILPVDADLSQGMKVGVLTITDDIYGSNTIVLTGVDAELFEIRDTSDRLVKELWLKAGVEFDAPGSVLEVIASLEGTGKGSNLDIDLVLNVISADGDLPIYITGNRGVAATTETDPIFVLGENGRLILADGTEAGVITVVDTKPAPSDPDQITFTIEGTNSDLFEIILLDHDDNANTPDRWVLRLKTSATALPSGSDYTITIVATDANSDEFRLDLRIKQGGLYIYDAAGADDGLSRVFTDGKALIPEEDDGSGTPVTIGALRSEITPQFIEVLDFELIDGVADNDQFEIERGDGADGAARTDDDVFTLKFIGPNSGDADIGPDVLNIRVLETYLKETAHEETVDENGDGSFAGTKDIDASGDTTDADTRIFALSGGGLSARDFIYQDLLGIDDDDITPESLASGDARLKASNPFDLLDFSNIDITAVFGGRAGFQTDIILPEGFMSGDTIWIRFNDVQFNNVKGVEVVIRLGDDGTSLIFTPTGAAKLIDYRPEGSSLTTAEIYQIDFTSDTPAPIKDGAITLAPRGTFTSDNWHIASIFVDGTAVVSSRFLDNTDTAVPLSKTNYDAVAGKTLSVVADDGGPSGNNIRVIVEIGTAANPTTGAKGVESVSVVDNVITVVTYSEGATWQNVADAINADTEAEALVDVEANPATAGNDAAARDFFLSGGKDVPALENNTNARLVDVEGGWIYPDDADAIRFEATTDLRVDLSAGEADIIVVPTGGLDGNGVRIGEVRLLTSNETPPEEYYVIGTTGNLSATDTVAATAVLEIDGAEYLRFTSNKAGAEGNGQEIRFEFSNNPVGGIFASTDTNGVIIIRITSGLDRDTVTSGPSKAVNDLIDVEYIGVLKDAGFFAASLFDGRMITVTLSGGEDFVQTTPTPATGTEVSTPEVLTWQEITSRTHDYQINLDNIDDHAPVFGEADGFEVTEPSDGSAPHGEASIDENDTNPGVIFQVSASDADGDVVTYSLADDFGLFEIDAATGEITLITGESADFEASASYDLQVIATSSFEGEAPKTTNFKVVVQVNDIAETGGAASGHILIGGENAQTLNASDRGDVIFGGQGDDTINLGAGRDTVIYRYDATDKTNPTAIDGGDVINSFDLSEDHLFLAHVGATDATLNTATAFFETIKGIRLLVDEDGRISGIVFTFTGHVNEAQDTDLTVNFDQGFDASQINLDASFDAAASGERVITTGQETAAYQAINQVLGESLVLVDFADVGFELNSGDTDIL